jgi:hypothetical protein
MAIRWKHLDTLANAQILGGAYLGSEDGKYVIMARRYRRGDKGFREYVVHYTTVEYVGSYKTGGANRTLYDGSSLEKAKAAAEVAVGGAREGGEASYKVGDRLELRLERHPIYSRRDVPAYRETTKRVVVKIVGDGYLVVHDGTRGFRLEGHEMGNRTTRYHVLSLTRIAS